MPREIAFVDECLADYSDLIGALSNSIDVVFLSDDSDGVEQIAEWLDGKSGIDAVHIISHGAPGSIRLGSADLSLRTLPAYDALLAGIGSALSDDADILLYGCDVASSSEGRSFVDQLALLTGADVAASVDPTGSSRLGGDADLEARAGDVTADLLLDQSTLQATNLILATPPSTIPPGTGEWIWLNLLGGQFFFANGTVGSSTEIDFYRFQASATGNYRIEVYPSTLNAVLAVYDSSGSQIAYSNDPLDPYAVETIGVHLTENSWCYIGIGGYQTTTGGYSIDIHGPPPAITDIVTPGPPYISVVEAEISPAGDLDWYRVVAPADTTSLSVSVMPSAGLNTVITLAAGMQVTATIVDNGGAGQPDTWTVNLIAGSEYYIGVTSLGSGTYSISADFNPDTPSPPEVEVASNGVNIADNDATPSLADHTDFGVVTVGGPTITYTFTINNLGTATLTLESLSVPAGFTVRDGLSAGLSGSIPGGASDSFQVRLDTTIPGPKAGQISFVTNDSDEGSFNFSVTGFVVAGGSTFDWSRDGKSDILWQNDDGRAGVWSLNGTTLLGDTILGPNPGPTWHIKGTGDFDQNGRSDIVWQNDDGRADIWLLSSSSNVSDAVLANNPGPTWHIIDTGHFNADGRTDLLWQNDDGRVAVWTIDGHTQIGGAVVGENPGPAWHVKAAGDFNADGKSDILWQNDDGRAAVWILDGMNFVSGAVVSENPGPSWHIKDSGDFNGDGKSDILWQNDDGRAAIWFLDGLSFISGSVVGSDPGSLWQAESAGDYNGDGKSDILWQHDDGQPGVWLMVGFGVLDSKLVGPNPGPTWHVDWI